MEEIQDIRDMATKRDIGELKIVTKSDIGELRKNMAKFRMDTNRDIEELRKELNKPSYSETKRQ